MTDHALPDSRIESLQKELSLAFGQVRTEHLASEELFEIFSTPVYWSQLVGKRPCMLIGGRGTGKTTTLRGLAYEGQSKLVGSDINEWTAVGAYWRFESNVVTAFRGRRVSEETWTHIFSHYVNLQLVLKLFEFVKWFENNSGPINFPDGDALALTSISLNIDGPQNLESLRKRVGYELAKLEAGLNSISRALGQLSLSSLGKPVEYLVKALRQDVRLDGFTFTFCLDEFENLQPYQQRVINTLIKHVGDGGYTFKIGTRNVSERERTTLAENQPLHDPADYTTIDIVDHLKEQSFASFAEKVCDGRLSRLPVGFRPEVSITHLLPELLEEQEAILLGGEWQREVVRNRLVQQKAPDSQLEHFDSMRLVSACMIGYWAEAQNSREIDVLDDAIRDPRKWMTRTRNHSYSLLFTLRKGKRGTRKYYSGWSTFAQISDGNIRYVLRLVYEALLIHVSGGHSLDKAVAAGDQTAAASRVGQMALRELEGLSERGAQLVRLNLGLGRIFQVMAAEPQGHAPEVNQFRISYNSDTDMDEVRSVLSAAVMHGALISFAGDKNARSSGETKDVDFQMHPIFSPYFEFSHRRKRRMTLGSGDFLSLTSKNSRRTIQKVLSRRVPVVDSALPEQLSIYDGFFNG
ncbi:hypothetical protein [Rhodococcus sp. IEGM1428]|uniref:ORC-CDC6 family AAA ATPase n=1 Tax=Rhodococcus sp. IEGM1428 TaxID=3392191 RepID=UPI003D13E473